MLLERRAERKTERMLRMFPAVVLLGARQVGKTTLAREIAGQRASVIFDLEDRATRQALLADPVAQLTRHDGKLVVLDEVQRVENIFEALRVAIDRLNPKAPGKFLLLGSASGTLLRQSKENLFGRAATVDLCGIDCLEIGVVGDVARLWDRGGFPKSYLAESDEESMVIRQQMCRQMLRDNLDESGLRVPADSLQRLLSCLARQKGGPANLKRIAGELEVGVTTVGRHLALLEEMMLIRKLPAFARVGGQSPVKKPKYYIRDSGLLHSLCNLKSVLSASGPLDDLRGTSWEGFAIENIMAVLPLLWQASFYRRDEKHEIDLVLQRPGGGLWAVEIKNCPDAHSVKLLKGNITALAHLKPERAFVVHGGTAGRKFLPGNVEALSLGAMMNELLAEEERRPESPSRRKPATSGRLAELVAALKSGRHDVPVEREEFIDSCLQRIQNVFMHSRGANDAAARRDWLGVRDELAEWFRLECRLDADAGNDCSRPIARNAQRLLEGVLDMKLTPGLTRPGRGAADCIALADLCACDLFVHFIAILLDSEKFAAVGSFLKHGYVAAEKLRDYRDFYYDISGNRMMHNADKGAETLPAGDAADELREHIKSSPLDLGRLLEAEQVIFISGATSKEGKAVFPLILACVPHGTLRPLELFLRAQARQGSMDLASCLENPIFSFDPANSMKDFMEKGESQVRELLDEDLYKKWRKIVAP